MARKLSNWLESFEKWFEGTEIPEIYAKAVGLSTLASALEKKVWFILGRYKIYCNLYCVLIGKPGIGKNQAINFGHKLLLAAAPDVKFSADSVSTRAFYSDLEGSSSIYTWKGQQYNHCSLTVLSREFEVFIGDKKSNSQLLINLTNFFDCADDSFTHKTQHSGSNKVENLWLNILGATTPSSLANCLSVAATEGGLTSRILFVYADKKRQNIAIPVLTPEQKDIENKLVHDLFLINQIINEYTMSEEAKTNYIEYYKTYLDKKICTDLRFEGWYSRKALFINKLAMIFSISESNNSLIEWRYYEQAISYLETLELKMSLAFKGLGKTDITADIDFVLEYIKTEKIVTYSTLTAQIWRNIDSLKLDYILNLLVTTKAISIDNSKITQSIVTYKFNKMI